MDAIVLICRVPHQMFGKGESSLYLVGGQSKVNGGEGNLARVGVERMQFWVNMVISFMVVF